MWRCLHFGFVFAIGLSCGPIELRGSESVAAESPAPRQLRVAAVQMRSTRDLAENVRKIDEQLVRCVADGVRVVVFPECALTGYFDDAFMRAITAEQLAGAEKHLADACRTHNIYAIVGTPYRDGDRLYNSAVVITPQGEILVRYHKVQLAESWPVGGDQLLVFKIDGVPASIIICHDERYPELVRLPVLAGARIVFYVCHESGLQEEKKIAPYRADSSAGRRKHRVRRASQRSGQPGYDGLARSKSFDRPGRQYHRRSVDFLRGCTRGHA